MARRVAARHGAAGRRPTSPPHGPAGKFPHMMEMTPERWAATERYTRDLFGGRDPLVADLMQRAVVAGLPDIAVSPDTGRLLMILASLTNGGRGAARALELGTLAGYTAIWIARGLAAGSKLFTVEPNPKHADFAQAEFVRCGLADKIEIRRAKALDEFPHLDTQFGRDSFDFIFADAIKTEYPAYFDWARTHLRRGGLFLAHNALGSRHWWVDAATSPQSDIERKAVDQLNRTIAADPDFDSVVLPTHQGLMVARRKLQLSRED